MELIPLVRKEMGNLHLDICLSSKQFGNLEKKHNVISLSTAEAKIP